MPKKLDCENVLKGQADNITATQDVHLTTQELRLRLKGSRHVQVDKLPHPVHKSKKQIDDYFANIAMPQLADTLPIDITGEKADLDDKREAATAILKEIDKVAVRNKKEEKKATKKKNSVKKYIARSGIVLLTLIVFAFYTVWSVCSVIANGPSESARNLAVQSALQASATKWVPGLFLSDEIIEQIKNQSEVVVRDVVSLDEYDKSTTDTGDKTTDKWSDAIDGVLYETYKGNTFQAYVTLIKDASRVFVGKSSDNYKAATEGITIFDAAEKYNALIAINGGEFLDAGGVGTGYAPSGLTYSNGECVWDDGSKKTFVGFTRDNKLVASENMTRSYADRIGIRDGVSFLTGNTLIEKDGDNIIRYYADGKSGTAQRTALGQAADGTVILVVTDGRTASSLGATHNDMIDLMVSYGAVSAGMVDGGSSSVMYYRDYFDKLGIDYNTLDTYQKKGLVNNYVAFTTPRKIPTFFIVSAG